MNLRPGLSMVTALRWLPEYRAEWLRPDLVAGLTLAAYLLPAGIGDASLAGLPPEAGLYACLFSGLVFWLLCSSKHTVITVTSALSLLIAASVGELSAGDPARHAALAAAVTIMMASLAFARGEVRDALQRLGFDGEYRCARVRADGRCGAGAMAGARVGGSLHVNSQLPRNFLRRTLYRCARNPMPMTMHDEGDNVYRLEIHGTLRKIDFERCQNVLIEHIARVGR